MRNFYFFLSSNQLRNSAFPGTGTPNGPVSRVEIYNFDLRFTVGPDNVKTLHYLEFKHADGSITKINLPPANPSNTPGKTVPMPAAGYTSIKVIKKNGGTPMQCRGQANPTAQVMAVVVHHDHCSFIAF